MSYPIKIEAEGWNLVTKTDNAALFQRTSLYDGDIDLLFSYADGTTFSIGSYTPLTNPALMGLGQSRDEELRDDDEYQAPEYHNQNLLMEISASLNVIPKPKTNFDRKMEIDRWGRPERNFVNPGITEMQRKETIDEILFEEKSMADAIGDIYSGGYGTSDYELWDGEDLVWDNFPRNSRATNARLWEIWHEQTGQADSYAERRRLSNMVEQARVRAIRAADDLFIQREMGDNEFSIVQFDRWMKGEGSTWPITGADVLYIEDQLRKSPRFNDSLSLQDNIRVLVGDEAIIRLEEFNNRAKENRFLDFKKRQAEAENEGDFKTYENSLHGTTKKNWQRIQLEGLKPAGERLSWEMIELIGDSNMPQIAIDDFSNGDEAVIDKARYHIDNTDQAMQDIADGNGIYMGTFEGFSIDADLERTVWATDDELVAAMFAESKYKTGSGLDEPLFQEGDYPVILEIEDNDDDGSHFIVDPSPVMNTKGAQFRAFPFGVPASRIKLVKEFKKLPGETQLQFNKRLSDTIWQKWVDRPEAREYFKRMAQLNGPMQRTWRTPSAQRSIEKVLWDRWDEPGAGLMPRPMKKAQAQAVASNIRNKKAGGGVHLARVIPVAGGYMVYERPKDRTWRGDRMVRRTRSRPGVSGNMYLKRRKLSRGGGF